MKLALLTAALFILGCDHMCSYGYDDWRCDGEIVQSCMPDNTWADIRDCGAVGEQCYHNPESCNGFYMSCCR